MSNKKIFGFCGRMASGKTNLAIAMQETYGATIITVASSLKVLLCDMLPNTFNSVHQVNMMKRMGIPLNLSLTKEIVKFISGETCISESLVGEECEKKKEILDTRELLQFIGTDIIRKYNPQWHVQKLKENILHCENEVVCVDDVRFPNEREAIENLGGECYFIIRPQSEIISNHESETSLRWQDFPYSNVIINNMSEEHMIKHFLEISKRVSPLQMDSPILLDSNQSYFRENVNFGYGAESKDNIILKKIIEQNRNEECFRKHGVISFYSEDRDELLNFGNLLFLSKINQSHHVIYNPLIYENLKFYL